MIWFVLGAYFMPSKTKNVGKIILELKNHENKFRLNTSVLDRLTDVFANLITYDIENEIVFICANEGIYLLQNAIVNQNKHYNLIVKRFYTNKDTLLANMDVNSISGMQILKIPYDANSIFLKLGFTSFESNRFEFSHMLEGLDTKFSEWSRESEFSVGNLFEGKYTLKIKARTDLENKI